MWGRDSLPINPFPACLNLLCWLMELYQMKPRFEFSIVVSLLLLTSCSVVPIGGSKNWVAMSDPAQRETVVIRAPGVLYPDVLEVNATSVVLSGGDGGGEVVLTDRAIRFLPRRDEAGQNAPACEILLGNIYKIRQDTHNGGPYMAIQTTDHKSYAFLVDEASYQSLVQALQSRTRRAMY